MDRENWTTVRKAFKERWPPLPEPEDDTESKREELEQMRLREEELGIKVAYRGQELYSHVAFANEAACLANEIGDINGFLADCMQSTPRSRQKHAERPRQETQNLGRL